MQGGIPALFLNRSLLYTCLNQQIRTARYSVGERALRAKSSVCACAFTAPVCVRGTRIPRQASRKQ